MLLSERISSHLFYYPVHHIAYFLATVQVCTSRVGAAGQIRQFISYKKPSLGESYRMVIYVTGFRFEGTQFYNLIQFPADPGTFLFRIGGNFIKSLHWSESKPYVIPYYRCIFLYHIWCELVSIFCIALCLLVSDAKIRDKEDSTIIFMKFFMNRPIDGITTSSEYPRILPHNHRIPCHT